MTEQATKSPPPTVLSVSVRNLVAFVHRDGGLSFAAYSGLTGQIGTQTHQAFYRALRQKASYHQAEEEIALEADWIGPDLVLHVRGRADLLLCSDDLPPKVSVMEVKTVAGPLQDTQLKGETLHWAQARLYAYMLGLPAQSGLSHLPSLQTFAVEAYRRQPVRYSLAYVSSEDLSCRILTREESWAELAAWFAETCQAYLLFAQNQARYNQLRQASIKALRFPFPRLRDGQKAFMTAVLRHLTTRTPLLVQAPTGTGKTLSTLYPAIKALGAGAVDQIFYLTAKSATQTVACGTLQILREQGLLLRSAALQAKEKICLCPECFCDTQICPYARNYYQQVGAAIDEGLANEAIDPALCRELGQKHQVCPFELQLDLATYCDVIIGDYNYVFDPRVRLERFFGSGCQQHHALLVDEAHNLAERALDMYSAVFEEETLLQAAASLQQFLPQALPALAPLQAYLARLREALLKTGAGSGQTSASAWSAVESDLRDAQVLSAPSFAALTQKPRQLLRLLGQFVSGCREWLQDIDELEAKRPVLDLYLQALFFLRVSGEFWSAAYCVFARVNRGKLTLRLACLDVSDKLIQVFRNQHAAVFFSATLTPLSYYNQVFCGLARDDRADSLDLPSPFPPENLKLLVASGIQTTYQERQASAIAVAQALALGVKAARGNCLIFFPSYAYLTQLQPLLLPLLQRVAATVLLQKPSMNEASRAAFLAAFDRPPVNGAYTVGVAVMGGSFSEGIDLLGDRLSGVLIVGVGLPQLGPEREILRQYYDEKSHNGFQYAYLYPGFNKVLQAAGRLIRSETDQGLLLLIDERYTRPDYRQLFPAHWQPVYCESLKELKSNLSSISR
ncbi:ATP-dependent DNA helicase [Oscillospiraceae bacterium HV4-5-C5C]|nr:ATP-dependent DNA helicase [Oscillospiraceae bacterium HV4-5-C5C]